MRSAPALLLVPAVSSLPTAVYTGCVPPGADEAGASPALAADLGWQVPDPLGVVVGCRHTHAGRTGIYVIRQYSAVSGVPAKMPAPSPEPPAP